MILKFWVKNKSKYIVLFLGSLFYMYEFFLRVSPSVMTGNFMSFYSVNAAELSIMSAAFFYAYMPMQIIAGLLGDRFGPRLLLTVATFLCGIMACVFVASNHILFAGIARFFIGLTASCAYIAPLILASHWFDKRYFPMISGGIQLLGSFGAYLAGAPLVIAMSYFHWQHVLICSGLFGIVLSGLIYLVVRDKPNSSLESKKTKKSLGLGQEGLRLREVCKKPASWWIAITGFAFWAPMSVFAELWGPSFLEKNEGVNLLQASEQIKWLWLGVAIGGPLLGYMSHKMNSCRKPMLLAFLGCFISTVWLIYFAHNNLVLVSISLFVFGFSCAGQCLTFGLVRRIHRLDVVGTAVGFNNMAVILGGMVLQPLAGWILDLYWQGSWAHHVHTFSLSAYRHAFAMLPAITLLGLAVTLFYIKEDFDAR